jgi:hypothetical protein
VADGLPSFALGGYEVVGPAGIVEIGGALYLATSHFVPGLEPRPYDAAVLRIDPASGEIETVADLGASEREKNHDGFIVESDPYGVARGADGLLYVADAGANALYRVDPTGDDLVLVTVFPGLPGEGENPGRNGAPSGTRCRPGWRPPRSAASTLASWAASPSHRGRPRLCTSAPTACWRTRPLA